MRTVRASRRAPKGRQKASWQSSSLFRPFGACQLRTRTTGSRPWLQLLRAFGAGRFPIRTQYLAAPETHGAWSCELRASRLDLLSLSRLPQVLLEQAEDPLVLVGPARRLDEAVVFHRIERHVPVRLAQLDEALREAHGVLEVHVGIDHTMAHQQRALQTLGEVDRR